MHVETYTIEVIIASQEVHLPPDHIPHSYIRKFACLKGFYIL